LKKNSSKLADDEGMTMLARDLPKMINKLKEFTEKKIGQI